MLKAIYILSFVAFFGATLLVNPAAQAQTTWYVDDDAPDDPGPGNPSVSDPLEDGSAEHPFDAIQEGVDAASDGDEVVVCDGTYTGDGNRDIDFAGRLITVRSENGADTCIIDCQGSELDPHRGFYFHSGETPAAVIAGLTVTGGYVDSSSPVGPGGGGINCVYSSPTLSNCTIVANTASGSTAAARGGGIHFYEADATLIQCRIGGNTAFTGGGVWSSYSQLTLNECVIEVNSSISWGGGICCHGPWRSRLMDCTINGNSTSDYGGGIYCGDGTPLTAVNCAMTGNAAFRGAGVYCFANSLYFPPRFTNCTIGGNTALDSGGGVYCDQSSLALTDCVISGNTAYYCYGGAIYCWHHSSPMLTNCIVADNTATWGAALACDSYQQTGPSHIVMRSCIVRNGADWLWNTDGSTLNLTYSDIQGGWPAIGNIDADPLFTDPDGPDNDPNTWEDNDYRLSPGSPCIDAGCNGAVPPDIADLDNDGDTDEITPLDLDSEGRFFDDPNTPDTGCGFAPIVDMGAYEFGDTGAQPCYGDLDNDRDVDLSDLAALLANYGESETCDGDLNCDGSVDLADLAALLAVYGTTCP